jgi:hypothetical protein
LSVANARGGNFVPFASKESGVSDARMKMATFYPVRGATARKPHADTGFERADAAAPRRLPQTPVPLVALGMPRAVPRPAVAAAHR